MLNRPSTRRKSQSEPLQLNLVPMMDCLVTMIAFLLYSMSFLALVSVESPIPIASTATTEQQLNEKPLQLTLSLRKNESEIWSPFNKIAPVKIKHLEDEKPDLAQIHAKLIEVKQKFVAENKIVLVPQPDTPYDALVAVMDSVRVLDKTDPAIFGKNAVTGLDEPIKVLFPEVVFGNILGD